MKSLVFVQYCINLGFVEGRVSTLCTGQCRNGKEPHMGEEETDDIDASDTLIRGRSKSSFNRELSSFKRRNFRSAMDCFLFLTSPPARIS